MTHRLSQLHCYFCSAYQLRHSSDQPMIDSARSNLRGLAMHCGNTSLAKAAAHHLDVCGYPEGNFSKQFTGGSPKGAA